MLQRKTKYYFESCVKGILKLLLLGFIQRNRAFQIIASNKDYCLKNEKKKKTQVPPQFLLMGATRELCLTALVQIDKREFLHFVKSVIDGAVCLGG